MASCINRSWLGRRSQGASGAGRRGSRDRGAPHGGDRRRARVRRLIFGSSAPGERGARRPRARRDDRRRRCRPPAGRATSTASCTRPRRSPPARARARVRARGLDREVEVAQGVLFPAWTYNGTVPGPVIRATEDDLLRVHFTNAGSHPHTIHFHGIHPAGHGRRLRDRRAGRDVHLRVPRAPVRDAPLPLPRDAAQEAHPQGPLRRLHHRSARAAPAGAGAGDGDERLRHGRRRREQLLRRERAGVLLRASTRSGSALASRSASTSRT